MAAGLAGTGLGIILAIGLFLAVGPRRTRLFSQIGATAVGASFALGAQAVAMLPDGARAAVLAMFAPPVNGGAPLPNLVWTPVRAAGGEPAAMLAWAGFGAAVFALACLLFGDRFAQAAVVSAGAPAGASGPSDRTARFGASVGGAARQGTARRLAGSVAHVATSAASRLYDAGCGDPLARRRRDRNGRPRLYPGPGGDCGPACWRARLGGAVGRGRAGFPQERPVSRAAVERGKITAIGQPIALVLALPLGALAFASPWAGVCGVSFGAGAVASAALVNLWRQAPSRRSLVLRRHSQSKLVGLMEHLVSILWAVATAIAVIGSWTVVVPLAGIAAVLAINRKWAAMEAAARG
jgi:ABC-2 type transport system permease protein